jgi:hypothetical protein
VLRPSKGHPKPDPTKIGSKKAKGKAASGEWETRPRVDKVTGERKGNINDDTLAAAVQLGETEDLKWYATTGTQGLSYGHARPPPPPYPRT